MPLNFPESVQQFIEYLKYQKRYSKHTVVAYGTDLQAFTDFLQLQFEVEDVTLVRAAMVRSWLASLKESGIDSRSITRKISSLKSFFKYQLKQGRLDTSPLAAIQAPRVKKRLPQYVEERDLNTLFQHVEFPDNWNGYTHRVLLQLLYQTGIRQAELISLREGQLDVSNQTLKVLGKGSKERIIPVGKEFMQLLQEYRQKKRQQFSAPDTQVLLVTDKGKPLYPKYAYNAVKSYLSLVSTIEKKSPHVLRHSFATHLVNHGAELNVVKELLGHSSLAATQVYTHNSIEKLKDVFRKAHPKA